MNKGIRMVKMGIWYELNAVEYTIEAFEKHRQKIIFHAHRFNILDDNSKTIRKSHISSLNIAVRRIVRQLCLFL